MQDSPSKRRTPAKWLPEEVESLTAGVGKHGVGNWKRIKKEYFDGTDRTNVDIKDKFRQLKKSGLFDANHDYDAQDKLCMCFYSSS